MSKLSFRARTLDSGKPMPVYVDGDIPALFDFASVNRAVVEMPTGMEKEEETVRADHPSPEWIRPSVAILFLCMNLWFIRVLDKIRFANIMKFIFYLYAAQIHICCRCDGFAFETIFTVKNVYFDHVIQVLLILICKWEYACVLNSRIIYCLPDATNGVIC